MGTFIGETIQAVRTLIRDPGLTAAAVFVLAMAVGGNAAMFGIVDALLLEPLPRGSATGVLVGVYSRDGSRPDAFRSFSYPNYTDLRTGRQLFSELVAQRFAQVTLTEGVKRHSKLTPWRHRKLTPEETAYVDRLPAVHRVPRASWTAGTPRPGRAARPITAIRAAGRTGCHPAGPERSGGRAQHVDTPAGPQLRALDLPASCL